MMKNFEPMSGVILNCESELREVLGDWYRKKR